MRKSLIWVAAGAIALGAVAGGVAVVGCSQDVGSSHPEVSSLKEGLNVLDVSDASYGMSAAYRSGDRAVYFESRVGPLKPDVYRQAAPDEPQNEMDFRVVDKDGHTFFAVRGGDTFIDPSWDKEFTASAKATVDPKLRELDFQIAHEGALALAGALPKGFADHAYHVAEFAARPVPSQDPHMQEKLTRIQSAPQETKYGTFSTAQSVWLETDLYSGQVCWGWICPAWHSATNMYAYQNGAWTWALNACNHGRCYGDSGMSYQCYSNGGWYGQETLYGETNSGGNTSVSSGCTTPYSWNDGCGQHLCNDDAEYELWQAKANWGGGNTQQGGGGNQGNNFYWNDYNGHDYACNYCSHSGDWSKPACP